MNIHVHIIYHISFQTHLIMKMGSKRFGAFIVYVSILSTILELIFFNIFFELERYSGPYPQLGAVLALYHRYTPRLHPKFFGILGYDFSEKSLTYGLCAQVILVGGLSTIIPVMIGFLSGMICVNFSKNELPSIVSSLAAVIGKSLFVDEAPAIMMARSVQRGAGGNNNRARATRAAAAPNSGGGRATAPPVVAPPRPPPPPPEEAIAQLTSMGFDREAVVRALQATDNNVEAAANRLLMG